MPPSYLISTSYILEILSLLLSRPHKQTRTILVYQIPTKVGDRAFANAVSRLPIANAPLLATLSRIAEPLFSSDQGVMKSPPRNTKELHSAIPSKHTPRKYVTLHRDCLFRSQSQSNGMTLKVPFPSKSPETSLSSCVSRKLTATGYLGLCVFLAPLRTLQ